MRKRALFVAILAALVAVPSAYACACCAEKGEWYEYTDAVDGRELSRLQFAGRAQVFVTAAGLEGIKGIRAPRASYPLTVQRRGRAWTFTFGTAGALSVTMPRRGEFYGADIRDGRLAGGGGPLLYKELRLRGPAGGTGAFVGGAFRLILMGRGNNCLNAADFRRWRLEISGPSARYALFGTLVKPRP